MHFLANFSPISGPFSIKPPQTCPKSAGGARKSLGASKASPKSARGSKPKQATKKAPVVTPEPEPEQETPYVHLIAFCGNSTADLLFNFYYFLFFCGLICRLWWVLGTRCTFLRRVRKSGRKSESDFFTEIYRAVEEKAPAAETSANSNNFSADFAAMEERLSKKVPIFSAFFGQFLPRFPRDLWRFC